MNVTEQGEHVSSALSTVSVVAPIVGVVIGAFLTGIITFFNNHKQFKLLEITEQKKLNIDRIEECYELLDTLKDYANKLVLELAVSIKELRQMNSDGIKRISTDRLELLSNLYFEKLIKDTQSLREHFSALTKELVEFYLNQNKADELSKKNLIKANEIVKQINISIGSMKKKLLDESKIVNKIV